MKKYVVSVNFGSYEDFSTEILVVADTRDEADELRAKLEKFFEGISRIVDAYLRLDNRYNLFITFEDFLKNKNNQIFIDYNDLVDQGMITWWLISLINSRGFESCDVSEAVYIQKHK